MTKDGTPETSSATAADPELADIPPKPEAGLYVTATPIGNIGDLTFRAERLLAMADVIACEDTRVTAKLLSRYGITTPTVAYHDHNATKVRPKLLRRLADGQVVALVSDAGTPLISDPGYRLVAEALDAGFHVTTLPGASSLLAALAVAGLPTDRFMFAGFLPPKSAARKRALAELGDIRATLVVMESARRLAASLADMAAVLGDRDAVVARELTKLHEDVRRGTLTALADAYARSGPPKGELVVVIGPPPDRPAATAAEVDAALTAALRTMSVREAVATVAGATGMPRRQVYRRALDLAADDGG
ncbi:MAG: 16S rRNA (cytidine(1402)-2'-O)-methyltransferase [Minwuiales bacterium]|nr:16S rRNA (cytidine(1402)-2'-O)-methyltransferase [Minwuiales bacterium]